VINIMIHALVTLTTIGTVRQAARWSTSRPRLHLMAVMATTALLLMLAHTAEIVVWSVVYGIVGAAPAGTDLLYFAFVNYTTLGYGDVTPLKEWRLIGPMTAMNGILMFGWSTAVLFEVLRKTIDFLAGIPRSRLNSADRG
jgi:Ion channel